LLSNLIWNLNDCVKSLNLTACARSFVSFF
jgi:hypothetical protein